MAVTIILDKKMVNVFQDISSRDEVVRLQRLLQAISDELWGPLPDKFETLNATPVEL
jgi:hypothetical protein